MPELVSQSRTQDEVFTAPDTAEVLLESQPTKLNPVEIKVHLPDSADQQQHAREKFEEILEELIESEKSYVNSLGNVQVCSTV